MLLGIAAAAALARVMTSMLDFVERPDASTYAAVAIVLLGVAAGAAFAPARRAIRADPMQTWRST